jgi:hypothetical protein
MLSCLSQNLHNLTVVWKSFFLLPGTVLFGAQMTLKNVEICSVVPKEAYYLVSLLQKKAQFLFFLQNIVKNLERQEVRDWLSSTKDLLMEEKKVNIKLTLPLKQKG